MALMTMESSFKRGVSKLYFGPLSSGSRGTILPRYWRGKNVRRKLR
jgi:hypothetical protein